ncbi:efflux RND transporter permease subunit [uncultured Caulobacter sp.]|uniref:sulfate/molybdate ABC transporter ATP-binding protein n=1 Tax=uncultured Caulobacter sp. TaxID=158749 RepID=UPI0026098041|nr:efflux RND transporter permease subunit [uncultured Caulobacter sp.]
MRALVELFLRRPVFTWVLVLGVVVLGLTGLAKMPIERFPNIDIAYVSVTIQAPGLSAEQVETEIAQRVEDLLKLVELEGLGQRYPSQLSGGQRQRVALSRALAVQPSVLLLDEPFGALDATVRKSLRRELRRVHDATGVTTIFVTHDQEEALELADRVAILNQGRIEQIGTPDQVHDQPASAFVCGFVGEANSFEGQVNGGRFNAGALALPASGVRDGAAMAYVRPHDFVLDDAGFEVRVDRAHVQGALTTVNATTLDGRRIEISASRAEAAHFQGAVRVAARKAHVYAA